MPLLRVPRFIPVSAALLLVACSGGNGDDTLTPVPCNSAELCDLTDNDCDGAVDEGVRGIYHLDSDGDGFGEYRGGEACTPPPGSVDNGTDCDDSDPDIYPGAQEDCDGNDDNCNGVVDDGVTLAFYLDEDGDGWGDQATPIFTCVQPAGYVSTPGDCDDRANGVNPGAQEICDEPGQDDDCDGAINEGDTLASGWAPSTCNPLNFDVPEPTPSSPGPPESTWTLASGLAVMVWQEKGPVVFEAEGEAQGLNDLTSKAQPLRLPILEFEIRGYLPALGFDGTSYTGDQDCFELVSPTDVGVSLELTVEDAAQVDLYLFDQASETLTPAAEGSLSATFLEGQTYMVIVAGRSGPATSYQVDLHPTGGEPTPFYQLWYSSIPVTNNGDGHIGLAVAGEPWRWEPGAADNFTPGHCPELDLRSVGQPSITLWEGGYHLWFRGITNAGVSLVGHATSYEGTLWKCDGTPALVSEVEGEELSLPQVVHLNDGGIQLWAARGGPCEAPPCEVNSLRSWTWEDGTWRFEADVLDVGGGRPCAAPITGYGVMPRENSLELTLSCEDGAGRGLILEGTSSTSGDITRWTWQEEPLIQGDDRLTVPEQLLSPARAWLPGGEGLWYLSRTVSTPTLLYASLAGNDISPGVIWEAQR